MSGEKRGPSETFCVVSSLTLAAYISTHFHGFFLDMAVAFLHHAIKSETKTWGLRQIHPSRVQAAVEFGPCGFLVDNLFTGSVGVGG